MTPEEAVADFSDKLIYDMLPEQVVSAVKRITLNTLAAMIAGSSAHSVLNLSELVRSWKGKQETSIFLHSAKVPMVEAALVNAAMARAMDFDDFHMETGIHASSTAIPTALAVAGAIPAVSGKSYIAAVAAGCEVMCRMRTVPDQCIGVSGWTGEIYGTFGAALTAAKLLGLESEAVSRSLGLAYAQSAGTSQAIYDGSEATCLQQGFATRAGLLATLLARSGLSGARNFLTGKAGLYPVYYRGMAYQIERLADSLGDRYLLLGIATKPYPACGFTMAPIENAIGLVTDHGIEASDIERVEIKVNKKMHATVCAPAQSKYRPTSPADALFSMPYAVATAFLNRDVRLEDFDESALKQPDRLKFMQRINIVEDENIEQEAIETNRPLGTHHMEIVCKDGRRFGRKLRYATGFPEKPMTLGQCAAKAKKVLGFAASPVDPESIDSLKEMVENLESVKDVGVLFDSLSGFGS